MSFDDPSGIVVGRGFFFEISTAARTTPAAMLLEVAPPAEV